MGAILADVKRDYVRTKLLKFADGATTVERLAEIFRDLGGEASRWINTEGDTLGRIGFTAALDMRYQGQAFDLQVPVPDAVRRKPKAASITELFHREHEKVYGFRESGTPIEITTVRLRITGKIPPIRLPTIPSGKRTRPRETRRVYHRGRHVAARVYDRGDLGLDDRIKGSGRRRARGDDGLDPPRLGRGRRPNRKPGASCGTVEPRKARRAEHPEERRQPLRRSLILSRIGAPRRRRRRARSAIGWDRLVGVFHLHKPEQVVAALEAQVHARGLEVGPEEAVALRNQVDKLHGEDGLPAGR